jgi:hypothetical protein
VVRVLPTVAGIIAISPPFPLHPPRTSPSGVAVTQHSQFPITTSDSRSPGYRARRGGGRRQKAFEMRWHGGGLSGQVIDG